MWRPREDNASINTAPAECEDNVDVDVDEEEHAAERDDERNLVQAEGRAVSAAAGRVLMGVHSDCLPEDPCSFVYLVFYLYGVASLVPWNFFIMANEYWMYKFRDVSPHNETVRLGKTRFQAEFTTYLNVASCLPSTFCLIANSLFGHLIPLYLRMGGSLIVITAFFILTTVMVQVDTDDWQDEFFILTIVTVIIINGAGSIFSGSTCGIAGKFSSCYMSAFINGQALGGIIAAVTQILSLTFKVSPLHSAFIYFIIGDVIIIVSLVSYAVLYKIEYFLFYTYGPTREYGVSTNNRVTYVSNVNVLRKAWMYALSIFLIVMVTTSVYPGITVLVESHHSGPGGDWNNKYFVPVINYLIFNCGDFAGRVVAGILLKPEKKSYIVPIVSTLRIIFIPLLMMCNAHPRSHLPVIIGSDWEYIILMLFFAVSNGYLANISMINAARVVDDHEKERVSSMMAAILGVGFSAGAVAGVGLIRSL